VCSGSTGHRSTACTDAGCRSLLRERTGRRTDLAVVPTSPLSSAACEAERSATESLVAAGRLDGRSDRTRSRSTQTRERETPATTPPQGVSPVSACKRNGRPRLRPTVEAPGSKRLRTFDGVLSAPEGVRGDSFATSARGADRNDPHTAPGHLRVRRASDPHALSAPCPEVRRRSRSVIGPRSPPPARIAANG
jgi:hypothetical protein